jgi:hypothetical protein
MKHLASSPWWQRIYKQMTTKGYVLVSEPSKKAGVFVARWVKPDSLINVPSFRRWYALEKAL